MMEELPGKVHKAWKKFADDFKIWQKKWDAQNPYEAKIIDKFMEQNKKHPGNNDPADFWKE